MLTVHVLLHVLPRPGSHFLFLAHRARRLLLLACYPCGSGSANRTAFARTAFLACLKACWPPLLPRGLRAAMLGSGSFRLTAGLLAVVGMHACTRLLLEPIVLARAAESDFRLGVSFTQFLFVSSLDDWGRGVISFLIIGCNILFLIAIAYMCVHTYKSHREAVVSQSSVCVCLPASSVLAARDCCRRPYFRFKPSVAGCCPFCCLASDVVSSGLSRSGAR